MKETPTHTQTIGSVEQLQTLPTLQNVHVATSAGVDPAVVNGTLEQLGRECREHLDQTQEHILHVAVRIAAAKEMLTKSGGRGSEFPRWLARHLPEMHQKTADRLASIAKAFHLKPDNLSSFLATADNFRLTALYELSNPSASDAAREEALSKANSGTLITLGVASELVKKHQVVEYVSATVSPNTNRPAPDAPVEKSNKTFQKTISLPAGNVTVSINHDDVGQALKEALLELDGGRRSRRSVKAPHNHKKENVDDRIL